jgi:hypothetical protein
MSSAISKTTSTRPRNSGTSWAAYRVRGRFFRWVVGASAIVAAIGALTEGSATTAASITAVDAQRVVDALSRFITATYVFPEKRASIVDTMRAAQRDGRPPLVLTPLAADLFAFPNTDDIRVQFRRDGSDVIGFDQITRDGQRIPSDRTGHAPRGSGARAPFAEVPPFTIRLTTLTSQPTIKGNRRRPR